MHTFFRITEVFGALFLGGMAGAIIASVWAEVKYNHENPRTAWRATWVVVGFTIFVGIAAISVQ